MDANVIRDKFAAEIGVAMARAEGAPMESCAQGCAYWIADIYAQVLGVDPASNWRRRYSNRTNEEAHAALGQRGFILALTRTAHRMNWRAIDPRKAAPGDFALIKPGRLFGPAIYDGGLWLCRVDGGYGGYPHSCVKRAWSVI